MTLEQLHQEYGRLMIQAEILQGRIQEVKKRIVEEMQKPRKNEKPVEKSTPVPSPDAK